MVSKALETIGITKRYGHLVANNAIDLQVRAGDIHAVMGENGAGKSTLMSILYGLVSPDEGQILLHGRETVFRSPIEAIDAGLGMVHQAFRLFDSLTVWENIVFGREPKRALRLDSRQARDQVAALSARYGLQVDPNKRIRDLSVGVRQRVEILKALYRNVRILILDEPTAVLTPLEREGLFEVMRSLKADGRTILFVSHKLHEVTEITDSITVLRDGSKVVDLDTASTTTDEIVRAMTGRNVQLRPKASLHSTGARVLEARNLTVIDKNRRAIVEGVDLRVRAGEVVGIAGVAGNGQTELVQAIVGLRPASGSVTLKDSEISTFTVAQRREAGISYIPEDRAKTGTAGEVGVAENLNLGFHRRYPQASGPWFKRKAVIDRARQLVAEFRIKVTGPNIPVSTLSGGNLQKVVVARELSHQSDLLIAEQPTRGVDVGAIEFIHEKILMERHEGRAVLLISSELWEVLGLSDQIYVMFEGRLKYAGDRASATEQLLGELMAGKSND
jgi:simple sugar transport system ATP-binding protein